MASLIAFMLSLNCATAFSLLGPFAPWMSPTNGYYNEIGGPMNVNEGYRWNVPVLTYGFDKSFLDYFSSNGVAAVESAIQILNDLPRASSIVLSNYPFETERVNYLAEYEGLSDLKSMTLSLLVEHLGLAQPTRNIFASRRWLGPELFPSYWETDESHWQPWFIPDFIVERNFDPENLNASRWVNATLYSAYILYDSDWSDIQEYPIDPLAGAYTAVADHTLGYTYLYFYAIPDYTSIGSGRFFTGVTWDDVGGLKYLYSPSLVNFETLLPGVHGVGEDAGSWVDGAWRPGLDKVSFVRHPVDAVTGQFLPMTNQFVDTFITNGVVTHQQLERIVGEPDFLFSAEDLSQDPFATFSTWRTDTRHWINNAQLNGNESGSGPGVIVPPVKITFHRLGPIVESEDAYTNAYVRPSGWGSFEGQTNSPMVFPIDGEGDTNHLTMRFRLYRNDYREHIGNFSWYLTMPRAGRVLLQTSTNLQDWMTVDVETNRGSVIEWQHVSSGPQRFFRAVPQ